MKQLRPEGLVNSPALSHVTTRVMANLEIALAAAGATVHDLPVAVPRVAGLAVPGALAEVSAVAAVTS